MAKNKLEKQRGALRGLGIAALVFGLIAMAGGVVMLILGVTNNLANNIKSVGGWLLVVFGVIIAVCGLLALIWGIYATWVGYSIKATNGSIAEGDLCKGAVNGKVCPKCGATNTPESKECQVCHTPLE